MNRKLLGIYLQDGLAAATGGLEMAKRAAGSNEGTTYGEYLAQVRDEVAEDRESLLGLMQALEVGPDHIKNASAWTAEKAGRLKLNGSLTSYSPLSRVVELDVLTLMARARLSMWEALRVVAPGEPELAEARLDILVERSQRQLEGLGRERAKAAREAFAD